VAIAGYAVGLMVNGMRKILVQAQVCVGACGVLEKSGL